MSGLEDLVTIRRNALQNLVSGYLHLAVAFPGFGAVSDVERVAILLIVRWRLILSETSCWGGLSLPRLEAQHAAQQNNVVTRVTTNNPPQQHYELQTNNANKAEVELGPIYGSLKRLARIPAKQITDSIKRVKSFGILLTSPPPNKSGP